MKRTGIAIILLFILLSSFASASFFDFLGFFIQNPDDPYEIIGQLEKGVAEIDADIPKTLTMESYYGLTSLTIDTKNNQENVELVVQRLKAQPDDVERNITCDVYRWLNLDLNIPEDNIENIEYNFQIDDNWLEEETRGDIDKIKFYRYNKELNLWEDLNAYFKRADSQDYYYFGNTAKINSYLIIAYEDDKCFKKPSLPSPATDPTADENIIVIPVEEEEEKSFDWTLFSIFSIIVFLAIILTIWYVTKSNRKF